MVRYAVDSAVFSKSTVRILPTPTAQLDPNNSSMKKLVSILAVPAILLLVKSAEATQLEIGISTYALSAPYVVAQLQPAAPAAEKSNTLTSEWRNIP
jgi:hypothetical protein